MWSDLFVVRHHQNIIKCVLLIPKHLILAWTRGKNVHVAVFPWTRNNFILNSGSELSSITVLLFICV